MLSCITFAQSSERNSTLVKPGEQSTLLIKWENPKVVDQTVIMALTNATTTYSANLTEVNTKMADVDMKLTQLLTREVDSKLTAINAKFGLTADRMKRAINRNNNIVTISLIIPCILLIFGWYRLLKYREKIQPQDFIVLIIIYAGIAIASWFVLNKGLTALFNHDYTQLQNIKNFI